MSDSAPPKSTTLRVWDLPLRLFHWSLVALIALTFLSSEEDSALAGWHIPAGWVVTLLLVFRLVWGFVGGEHSRFASFLRPGAVGEHIRHLLKGRVAPTLGHNPLGAVAVVLLLALIALTVGSGVAGGEDLHEAVAWGLLALIAVHVLAVIAMSVLTRENLPRAFLTGLKSADLHPHGQDAAPAPGWAAPAAIAAVVLSAAAVQAIDPGAFSPTAHRDGGEAQDHDEGEDEGDEPARPNSLF